MTGLLGRCKAHRRPGLVLSILIREGGASLTLTDKPEASLENRSLIKGQKMKTKKLRVFGSKLDFKSPSCAPISEHGQTFRDVGDKGD
jgi:hypothetical protein